MITPFEITFLPDLSVHNCSRILHFTGNVFSSKINHGTNVDERKKKQKNWIIYTSYLNSLLTESSQSNEGFKEITIKVKYRTSCYLLNKKRLRASIYQEWLLELKHISKIVSEGNGKKKKSSIVSSASVGFLFTFYWPGEFVFSYRLINGFHVLYNDGIF